jgi:hypothetical protein
MSGVTPADRFDLLRNIQRLFDEELDTFPAKLRPDIIRSYCPEDYNSPGLLSLVALPYWIGERLNIEQKICQDMAVGNLFLLHCFQSFDFIVDKDRPNTSDRSQIILGNLCFLQVLRHYRSYFPGDSLFWRQMELYWREWGESLSWEMEPKNSRRHFEEAYLLRAAHKAAALKICPTGLSILADQLELIPRFELAVDLMHASMQLLDDLLDWEEDLQHGRYNAFLGLMITKELLPANQTNSSLDVYSVISNSNILEQYADLSCDYAEKAKDLTISLDIEPWTRLVAGLAAQARWLTGEFRQKLKTYVPESQISRGIANE